MLHSERIFKVKVRSRLIAFEISLTLAVKEIVQYLENYKHHEVDQGHSKRLLQNSRRASLPYFLDDF